MIFDSIDEDNSLSQGGTYIGFMIRHLVNISKDVIEFNFFKIFHLGYYLRVVVGQSHVIRGLLHIESLDDDSGIPYDSQFLDG